MTENETIYLMMRGVISELDQTEREKVESAHAEIVEVVKKHGNPGMLAHALMSCEIASGRLKL